MQMMKKRMWAQCLGVLLLVAGLASAAPPEEG